LTAAFRADGDIHACEPFHDFYGGFIYSFSAFAFWINQLPDFGNASFIVAMRQKPEIPNFMKPSGSKTGNPGTALGKPGIFCYCFFHRMA
jgi:hypothetical protein